MAPTLWLLGFVLAPAQPAERPFARTPAAPALRGADWALVPRLHRAQELIYHGTFTEEANGARVQFRRDYDFETRLFVLDTPPRGADVAVLTTLKAKALAATPPGVQVNPVSSSARLERVRVDLQGRVVPDPTVSLAVPLDGPPTLECGAFVEAPHGRVAGGQRWPQVEPGQPVRTWEAQGTEMVLGALCVKLVATQQSADWERPRADRPAWRRTDTVWVAPRLGLAQRVERRIEHREPAHLQASQWSALRYDLESSLQVPGQLSEDRRQEVLQALAFRDAAAPLLPAPARYVRQLDALLARIKHHLEHQPPTPYRQAVLQVQRQVEAARRGEAVAPFGPAPRPSPTATLGEPAPDFAATDFAAPTPFRLGRNLGKPVVLVFYQPSSVTAPDLLRFAQQLSTTFARHATVVGLSVSEDCKPVLAQRDALKLTFPLLDGSGLRTNYAVETTPKIVLLDASGVVRGAYFGWGRETSAEVVEELRNWLKRD
jgi:peroxiredoxin